MRDRMLRRPSLAIVHLLTYKRDASVSQNTERGRTEADNDAQHDRAEAPVHQWYVVLLEHHILVRAQGTGPRTSLARRACRAHAWLRPDPSKVESARKVRGRDHTRIGGPRWTSDGTPSCACRRLYARRWPRTGGQVIECKPTRLLPARGVQKSPGTLNVQEGPSTSSKDDDPRVVSKSAWLVGPPAVPTWTLDSVHRPNCTDVSFFSTHTD